MAAKSRLRKWLFCAALTAVACWTISPPAAAQCAMCYKTAAGAGTKVIEALRSGILVLLIPTVTLFVGILVLAYRRRNLDSLWESVPAPESQVADGWGEQAAYPGERVS